MQRDLCHFFRRPMKLRFTLVILCISACSAVSIGQEPDFNQDIRPILSDKCFYCHGPDSNTREADLRLDQRDAAIAVIESGELIDRIMSDDQDTLMPPPDSNLSLAAEEKQMLQAWIGKGAAYKGHWSFQLLPEVVKVPSVKNQKWCRTTIDRFVLANLERKELVPSAPAAPLRWLRRVTLDLTGLPPTPQQITAFESALTESTLTESTLRESSDTAYEDAVESLLDSAAFGEHMAVAWLDAARYADSYGYQSDKLNTQWPYRDWVVAAFNQNLAYDKFLTWQLAGDLLPNPTQDQLVATAFNRIHRLNNEGGAVFEEWRIENVADRVHTFGTAVLGLTMECCRCHDHKYDPIPAKDYYALSAFFNSIDESGVYDRTQKVPCPSILLPTPQQQAALQDASDAQDRAERKYREALASAHERWGTWSEKESDVPKSIPDLRLAMAFDRKFDNSLKETYHPSQSDRSWAPMCDLVPVTDSSLPRMDPKSAVDIDETNDAPPRLALKLDGERGVTTHGIAPFDRWLPMSVVVSLRETKRVPQRSLIAHHTRGTDCGYNGWDLTIENGHLESRMARVWPGNAISVRTVDPIPMNVWHQVTATYDGSSKASGLKLYLNGKPLATKSIRDQLKKSCNVKVDHGGEFVIGQRFRARGLDGGLIDDVRIYDRALTETELRMLAGETRADTDELGFDYFASAIDEPTRTAMTALTKARERYVMAEEVMNEIPVMREMGSPRPAHVLARGEYDAPRSDKTLVARATLSALPLAFPDDAPNNRLGLAKWVTDPQHPLTARVAVNRFWGNFFSSPLVRTPENFGSQGELPTQPELLDWLARDFISNGWDVKRLCREIVLSATYRQDSGATPEQLKADPTNRSLSRGPSHRLAAEQIRDVALSASGLMDATIGGPPVSPYQPGEDLWRESNGMSPPFKQSVGKALYRRSLYSVWKRTAPLPNMMAFDSTTREVCIVKRSRTNTPLQALVLLNDVQFIEAARVMATELLLSKTNAGDALSRVEQAFLRLAGRLPDQLERTTLTQLLADERSYYAKNPDAAAKLLTLGDAELNSKADAVELAALTNVCQAILNLDATIWKR